MTNSSQQVTTTNGHGSPHPHVAARPRRRREACDDVLLLIGGEPQTVFVHLDPKTHEVTFSQKGTREYREIEWQTNGYALMITFVFSPNIDELMPTTPSLWISDTFHTEDDPATKQMCCIGAVLGEYNFGVISGPIRVDPKIIVTPIVTP